MCLGLKQIISFVSDFNLENRLEAEKNTFLLTTNKYKTHKFYALLNKDMKF